MKTIWVLLTGILFRTVCSNSNGTDFIKDFLLQQREPTKVTAVLCWTKAEKIHLLKTLHQHYFQVAMPKFSAEELSRPFPEEHQLFLADLSCVGVETILTKAEELGLFQHPFRWLVLKANRSSNVNVLDNLPLVLDSKFFVADSADFFKYNVEGIYKIRKKGTILSNDIASWRQGFGFEYFNEMVIPRNRSDLKGINLNVPYVVTNLNSLNHLQDNVDRHIDTATKISFVFIQHLLELMNASGSLKMHRSWGYRNGSTVYYTGMIGDLQRGEAEIGGTAAFMTKDRFPLIEYVSPTTPTSIKFIFKAPPLSYITNIFVLPFDGLVWASSFVLIMLTALTMYVIVVWEWKKFKDLPEEEQDHRKVTRLNENFFDAFMVQIGGVCQQGYEDEPKSPAGRIVFIFSFIAFMFLYTSYSANIVALLQSTSDDIQTLEDLLKSRLQLGVDDQPYNHHYFSTQIDPIRKAIYQEKVAPKGQTPNFMTIEKGVAKMRHEFFAFNVEVASAYKVISDTFMEHEKCGLIEIEYLQVTGPWGPWIPIRKNSSYYELVKVGFSRFHESGIRHREVTRFFHKKPPCIGGGSNFMSVGLVESYHAFLIFGVGCGCALALLVLEVLSRKYDMKRRLKMVHN